MTCMIEFQGDKNAGLAREAVLLEGKCQLKAALSSALESKAEVELALQTALQDKQRLQQEACPLCKEHSYMYWPCQVLQSAKTGHYCSKWYGI